MCVLGMGRWIFYIIGMSVRDEKLQAAKNLWNLFERSPLFPSALCTYMSVRNYLHTSIHT